MKRLSNLPIVIFTIFLANIAYRVLIIPGQHSFIEKAAVKGRIPTNCDVAPNCKARNRNQCSEPSFRCGKCLDGFYSDDDELYMEGNSPCLAIPETSHIQKQRLDMPTIDVQAFFEGDSLEQQEAEKAVKELVLGAGFAYLKNHGLDSSLLSHVLEDAQSFFALPYEIKESKIDDSKPGSYGSYYAGVGNETLNEDGKADEEPKESYNIRGKEHLLAHPIWSNSSLVEYWEEMKILREKVLFILTKAMQLWIPGASALPDDFLIRRHKDPSVNLRVLNYIELASTKLNRSVVRCAPHTDFGTVTLLFQDKTGGLEVFNRKTGHFQPVPYKKDTILVNIGDLINRWTNDMFVSTLHQVVSQSPTGKRNVLKARNSIAYFLSPDPETIVDPRDILGEEIAAQNIKYAPVNSKEYLLRRINTIYGRSKLET